MESRELLLQLCPEREGSMVACRVACLATIEKAPREDVLSKGGVRFTTQLFSLAPAFNPLALSRTNLVIVVVSHKGNWVSNQR